MSITKAEAEQIQADRRTELIEELVRLDWFIATDPALQEELRALPLNHNGFLEDLVTRPAQIGNLTVLRLNSLARGGFALIARFDVVNENDQNYTYEYVSWRYGTLSGAKGLVLVRDDNSDEITHVILKRGVKFATGQEEFDLVGGFMDFGVEGVKTLVDQIVLEMQQELNAPDLTINEEDIHLLGSLAIDPGMTNNRPSVFAAVISSSDASTISTLESHVDEWELAAGTVVFNIDKLHELIEQNEDGFFATALLRAVTKGLIPASALVR